MNEQPEETIFVRKDRRYNRRFLQQPLSGRSRCLHAGLGLGKGQVEKPGWTGPSAQMVPGGERRRSLVQTGVVKPT